MMPHARAVFEFSESFAVPISQGFYERGLTVSHRTRRKIESTIDISVAKNAKGFKSFRIQATLH